MKKWICMLVALTLVLTCFAGCGKQNAADPAPEDAQQTEETPANNETEDSGETAGQVKIGWHAPAANQYTDAVNQAVELFMADFPDADVRVVYGDNNEQASMDAQIRALVADGYTNISAFPATQGAAGLYDELVAQGCNVVGYGAATTTQSEQMTVASDVKAAAYTGTEYLIEAMGGQGGILNVLGVLNDSNTTLRREGVEESVAEHEGVEIVQEVSDINNVEEGVTKISSALSANQGKINGIICTDTNASSAAAQVLYDYYARNEDAEPIMLICLDATDDVLKGIEDGVVTATVAQNTEAHGYVACAALYYMASEGYVPAEGQFLIDAGVVMVTKDNLDTYQDELHQLTLDITEDLTTTYLTKP